MFTREEKAAVFEDGHIVVLQGQLETFCLLVRSVRPYPHTSVLRDNQHCLTCNVEMQNMTFTPIHMFMGSSGF